jgi:hypothetical protein
MSHASTAAHHDATAYREELYLLCHARCLVGVWLGMLGALGITHTRIRPHVWKRTLGLTSDKERARLRAMQLFPTADLRRKKDHGRAEALLLGYYGWQHLMSAERGRCQDMVKN